MLDRYAHACAEIEAAAIAAEAAARESREAADAFGRLADRLRALKEHPTAGAEVWSTRAASEGLLIVAKAGILARQAAARAACSVVTRRALIFSGAWMAGDPQ